MPIDPEKTWVFRMIHFSNLEYILQNGIYYRNSPQFDPNYVNIGSSEIIQRRDKVIVKCYPDSYVNEYIPFYFGVRTPMLYNIHTGFGVARTPQEEVIYLCCRFADFVKGNGQWCFTDGNATMEITEFFTDADDLEKLDWRSIKATDWREANADGDTDRRRKKHSEFLVKDHVPVNYIKRIVVLTGERQQYVQNLIEKYDLSTKVLINPDSKFYF